MAPRTRKKFYLPSDLQSALISKIKETYLNDVWVYKTHDLCRIGIPDLIICFFGHFLAIELKKPHRNARRVGVHDKPDHIDSDLSPMQTYNIKLINRAGGTAFVARSIPQVMERLEKIRKSLMFFTPPGNESYN